jgi:hypothetical protein
MVQRGRKSASSLTFPNVEGKPNRLQPPAYLSAAERRLFNELIATTHPRHFVAAANQLRAGQRHGP